MPGQVLGANASTSPVIPVRKFGVRWHKNQSPTALTRLYDAEGKKFTASVGTSTGSSDFDYEPIYRDIKLCNVVNGHVMAYYGDAGFSRTPANGDVMVEIPRFYYKIVETDTYRDYIISDQYLDGFLISPRHAGHIGKPEGYDKIYVSAYTVNNSYRSISGNTSVVSLTRATARNGCTDRGAGYYQYDFATYWSILLLYLVEVANWNSQAIIGSGNTSGVGAQTETGATDGVTGHTGRATTNATETQNCVKYRHMENLWGNLWHFIDGVNFNDDTIYICMNPAQYADDTMVNYNSLGYKKPASNGFIKALGYDQNYPWAQICTDSTGANGTYIPDYYWYNTGWCVGFVGGYSSTGANAGLFTFGSNYASMNTYTSVGCRLLVLPS